MMGRKGKRGKDKGIKSKIGDRRIMLDID